MKAEDYLNKKSLEESDIELDGEIYFKRSSIINWLQDFAKQEAIEFARYVSCNWYRLDVDRYCHPYSTGDLSKTYTIAELYDQFKKEQDD